NNTDASRYEVQLDDGQFALIDYKLRGDLIIMTHTEVPLEYEGRGIASNLVKFALDDARAQGYQVKPSCPFVRNYIKRHPEYESLVATQPSAN
ncbi:MAG: N-acetyltransferase, partial [Okeania sp. SIO3B3]|nr:N-acetyltransferase [Okeania sp. SIO3B3]